MWQTGNPGSLQPHSWRRELLKFPSCRSISLFFKNGREVVYWQEEMVRSFPSVPSSASLGHSSDGLAFTRSSRSPKTSQSPEAILRTCEVPLKTVLGWGRSQSHCAVLHGVGVEKFYLCSNKRTKRQGSGCTISPERDSFLFVKGNHFLTPHQGTVCLPTSQKPISVPVLPAHLLTFLSFPAPTCLLRCGCWASLGPYLRLWSK